MNKSSQLSIRGLLALTALFCLACIPLAKPSVWWALLLPAFCCLSTVFAVSRFAVSPARGAVFWACFLSGVIAYLGTVVLVSLVSIQRHFGQDFWGDYIGMPVWRLLHSDEAFITNRRGVILGDLISFMVALHVVIAMAVAAPAAFVAQYRAAEPPPMSIRPAADN
jgi:hypothetical protein